MANGKQLGGENYAIFLSWSTSRSDEDFKEYINRFGFINRVEIAKECGFSKSVLGSNPAIKKALKELEDGLRYRGILPQPAESKDAQPAMRDSTAAQANRDSQRLNQLEQKYAAAQAEIKAMKAQLSKHSLMTEHLALTGRLPR
jgi:hypothetical protein